MFVSIFLIEELPEDWNHVSDIQSLRPLDRSFLFPGKILSFFGAQFSVFKYVIWSARSFRKLHGPNFNL